MNTPTPTTPAETPLRPYIAFYNGRRLELWARTSHAAQARATIEFNPPKSKRHMVHVHLADIARDTFSL